MSDPCLTCPLWVCARRLRPRMGVIISRRGRRLVYRRRSCFRTLTLDAGTPSQTSTGSRTPDKLLAPSSVENPPAPGSPSALDLLCGPVPFLCLPHRSAGREATLLYRALLSHPASCTAAKGGGGARETSVERGTAALRSTSFSRELR